MTTAKDEEKLQITKPENSFFGFLTVEGIFKKFHINVTSGWHCKATCVFRGLKSFALATDPKDLKTLPAPPANSIPLCCPCLTAFPWLLQYFSGIRAGPSGSVSDSSLCQLEQTTVGWESEWGGESLDRAKPGYSLQFYL